MKKLVSALALSLFACSGAGTVEPQKNDPAPAASVSPAALAVEQALRDLDAAKDLPSVKARLAAAVDDATLPDAVRDQATLGLARALDALGDKEAATEKVEALMKKHVDDHPWALEDKADDLLQKLVTGTVVKRAHEDDPVPPAPVARALAKFFPVVDAKVKITTFMVGNSHVTSNRLGTFSIGEAIRLMRREACPLCDDNLSVHHYSSSSGTWTRIPAERSRYEDGLVVFWFDLDTRRIPARYDALLPMPSADIVARLEKGEGLVAVKTREGAPPVIVLAAPREAQLADVEESFAAMKELPAAPVSIALSSRLRPGEIQTVVRGARSEMKACADALLAKNKSASGKLVVKMKVHGDGTTSDVAIEPQGSGLDDATFLQCVEKTVTPLAFPKSGAETNVSYPIAITAG